MNDDLKEGFALRQKLITEFESSTNMTNTQTNDFKNLIQFQDDLLEFLTSQLESAIKTIKLHEKHISNLDAQLKKYEIIFDQMLSQPPDMKD